MSKDIFEKAQESFKRYQRFNDPNNDNQYFLEQDDIPNVEKAIELGKKQEKLLHLYSKLADEYKKLFKQLDIEAEEYTSYDVFGNIEDESMILTMSRGDADAVNTYWQIEYILNDIKKEAGNE